MRSPHTRWFFCDYKYPADSLMDVVACIQSRSLDVGSPIVIKEKNKKYYHLQCKYRRAHVGKFLPPGVVYEEGTRSTSFIDNKNSGSRGPLGMIRF